MSNRDDTDYQTETLTRAAQGDTAPGEEFIELGLLFFVTGLIIVLIGAVVEFLLLREREALSNWTIILVGAIAVSVLAYLAIKLTRRLLWFIARLK